MKLDWTNPAAPNGSCSYDHCRATTPFGDYQIEWKSWKDYPAYGVEFEGNYLVTGDSLDAAKEAAQSDFDTRLALCTANKPS